MATTSAKPRKSERRAASCSVPPGEPVPVIKGSHVYLVDGSGYFFFPDAVAPKGVPLCFWVNFTATEDAALLRGWVWARPPGGLWLELTGAELSLEKIEQSQQRGNPRVASGQLVLAEAQYRPAMLCRLRDVSLGGARGRAVSTGDAARRNDPGAAAPARQQLSLEVRGRWCCTIRGGSWWFLAVKNAIAASAFLAVARFQLFRYGMWRSAPRYARI